MPLIDSIVIDTQLLPQITIDNPLGAGEPNFFLSILKPKITATVAGNQIVSASYGEPTSYWPFIRVALILIALLFLIKIFK